MSTTYHPSSFASAAQAVAEDLEAIHEELKTALTKHGVEWRYGDCSHVLYRLDVQSQALREMARKSWQNDWGHHSAVDTIDPKAIDDGPFMPDLDPDDLDGPSYNDPPDEPRRR